MPTGQSLVADPKTVTIEPCDFNVSFCGGPFDDQVAQFTETGSILPETIDDSASADAGKAVVVDVLANDTSDDPNTDLSFDAVPANGAAEIIGSPAAAAPTEDPTVLGWGVLSSRSVVLAAVAAGGTQRIRYTPGSDFSGVGTFTYALANGNGATAATAATVTVTVRAGQVVDTTEDEQDGVLPDTGSSDASPLGLAALLLAGGGTLLARGRRRPRGIHLG